MIYYSHVNEDNWVERNFIGQRSFEEIICIAGSGERVTALLDTPGLKKVHIVDQNLAALYLIELKIVALEKLSPTDYRQFLGFAPQLPAGRLERYQTIRPALSTDCARYWDQRMEDIAQGVVFIGHFEKFLARIRPMIRWFLGRGFLAMLHGDYAKFPKVKWRLLAWFFRQKWVYRLFGNQDAAFVSLGTEVHLIPTAIYTSIQRRELHRSFMAHLIFNGHLAALAEDNQPPSLREERLLKIKGRLQHNKIELIYVHADLLEFLSTYQPEEENNRLFASFSDILSFTPPRYFFDCLDRLRGQRLLAVVIRAFLKNRLQDAEIEFVRNRGFSIVDASDTDTTGMYQVLNLADFGSER